jgi:hypothetical protein
MKRLPEAVASWKKEGMEWYRKDTAMFQKFMDEVKSQVVSIILFESFVRTIFIVAFTKIERRKSETKLCCWTRRESEDTPA